MSGLRHEFYETDETLTLSIFDKGADPNEVSVSFEPTKLTYKNGESKSLVLEHLKSAINPEKCSYTVGRVKVEIKLSKLIHGRWGALEGDSVDAPTPFPTPSKPSTSEEKSKPPRKNWDGVASAALAEVEKGEDSKDPNLGDAAAQSFFQKLYESADEDTKKAMLKSYQESAGTALSTNWEEVKKDRVPVQPPQGSEFKKWN